MKIERREFLKLIGGGTGAVIIGGAGLGQLIDVPDRLIEQARSGAGIETWSNTVCGLCPGGCGLRVRLVDGIPVYVKGNPVYPVNQGGMCALGHASLETLFNPDRLQGPLTHVGPPGRGRFEPMEWADALSTISGRLQQLRSERRPHQVAFIGGSSQGSMHHHIGRFMRAYGSPNYFQTPSDQTEAVPYLLTSGRAQAPAFDLLHTRTVLSFGANFLEEDHAPVHYTKLFSQDTEEGRPRLIQIEPRISITGANADRWVPIRPGTYGALALGIAHVLLRESLYDADFVRNRTFGFDDWTDRSGEGHRGFRSLVLESYYPERVSEITGVPSRTILEVARELGISQPSLVIPGSGVADNTNGTYAVMAIQSLNALLGNFGKVGGLFDVSPPPFAELPPLVPDNIAEFGLSQPSVGTYPDGRAPYSTFSVDAFSDNILSGNPYPIEVLFLHGGNPLFQALRHHDFGEALGRIPLVVCFESYLTETAEFADIVLPEPSFLESWDLISEVPTVGFAHAGIRQPVIEPLYDTRQAADVLIALASEVGGPTAASFPFDSYEDVLRHRARGLYESGTGAIAAEGMQDSWLEYLQQRGWHSGQYDSFDSFWRQLVDHGGWWNPVRDRQSNQFGTPSGRYEFYAQALFETVGALAQPGESTDQVLRRIGVPVTGDEAFLPHHDPVPTPDVGLPLHLITFYPLSSRADRGSNLPLIRELFGRSAHRPWQTWVEINPDTAAQYGVADGDWIWVQSAVGSIRVRATVVPGIMPEAIAIPFGLGHTAGGRFAVGHGAHPYQVVRNLSDSINGRPAILATRVNLSTTA